MVFNYSPMNTPSIPLLPSNCQTFFTNSIIHDAACFQRWVFQSDLDTVKIWVGMMIVLQAPGPNNCVYTWVGSRRWRKLGGWSCHLKRYFHSSEICLRHWDSLSSSTAPICNTSPFMTKWNYRHVSWTLYNQPKSQTRPLFFPATGIFYVRFIAAVTRTSSHLGSWNAVEEFRARTSAFELCLCQDAVVFVSLVGELI